MLDSFRGVPCLEAMGRGTYAIPWVRRDGVRRIGVSTFVYPMKKLFASVSATAAVLLFFGAQACSSDAPDDFGAGGTGGTGVAGGTGGSAIAGGAPGVGGTSMAGSAGMPVAAGGMPGTGGALPSMGGASGSLGVGGDAPIAGMGGGGESTGGLGGMAGMAGDTGKPPSTLIGDVEFSTPSQSFRDQLAVGLSTGIAGSEIRYTVDGTLPTAASTLYDGTPISLTATTQLRAQPFSAGSASGSASTAVYIARTFDLSSDLPIVLIDGYGTGKPEDKEVYKDVAFMVFEPQNGTTTLTVLPNLATRGGYHVRGQSSANFPQTPYKIEFWDNNGKDADYPLLGMPSDSDWALIPPYYDRALIRNPFVYTLGRDMGMEAPRTAYAEVYINYESRPVSDADYQGIYWISETIKNNKVRTNLKQLEEEDKVAPKISGGYIFKFDQLAAEEPKLLCTGSDPIPGGFGGPGGPGGPGGGGMGGGGSTGTCWTDLELVDPDPTNVEQTTWLTAYIQQFHDSLHTTPIGNYAEFIDVPSFVDYLIVNELTRNVDAYVRSAYYFKDRDGKLKAGPLWDYNFSLAVGGQGTIDPAGGWQFQGTRNINNWYPKLTSDPAFMTLVKARYAELRQNLLSTAAMEQRITMLSAPLTNAVARDFVKWPVADVYPTSNGFVRGPTVATWPEQVQAMRDYVSARLTWMDTQLAQ
jgi:hypothetical protein